MKVIITYIVILVLLLIGVFNIPPKNPNSYNLHQCRNVSDIA